MLPIRRKSKFFQLDFSKFLLEKFSWKNLDFRLIGNFKILDFRLIGNFKILDFCLIGNFKILDFHLIGNLNVWISV